MQRIFSLHPEGVRDIYGEECSRKKRLQKELHQVFSRYGYEDIETPGFEYFEVFSNEVGTIPSKDLYKFLTERETHLFSDLTLHRLFPEHVQLILIRKRDL